MIFLEPRLPGAFIVEIEPREDVCGLFARTFCAGEFSARGLESNFVQCNLSLSRQKGTLRGLHFQRSLWGEVKLVRCVRGAIWDVIVDLRTKSPTFGRHEGLELSAKNRLALYVPKAFARGFQTLMNNTEMHYQMGSCYMAEAADGIRADDPALGIQWPLPMTLISERDRGLHTLAEIKDGLFREANPAVLEPVHPVGGAA